VNWYERARNSNRSQLTAIRTVLSLATSFAMMVLAFFAWDHFRWKWLLMLAIALAFLILGIFIWTLWREMRGFGEPSLFRPSGNAYFIDGPPGRVFTSLAALVVVGLYGIYALAMGRAYALTPDGIGLLEGIACRLYGTASLLTCFAGIVRFHSQWRWSHAAFGVLAVLAVLFGVAGLIIHEDR
jgi:hypothetical protein